MKKLIALVLALTMVMVLFAGCGGDTTSSTPGSQADSSADVSGEPEEQMLVGFSTVSMSQSIYVLQEEALKEIFAGKAEVQTASCDSNVATQIQHIKNFALMGADLIVINPSDIDALADAIKEAHDAGCKIYINGATSDSLSEEYYECCTVSDEYLCGAYVAMIAKNWIEAHADQLDAANPDWELAFLESSLADETIKRSRGIQSIVEPYLKDWEGNYVDANGNIVDESGKVENPAYCQIAADHYKGAKAEQDLSNAALNVANIMTSNPNVRVFLCYTSLASVQGGQYIVDNYGDQIDNFAFFSAGVMGNEADYIVGSVSDTDGVPSVMRGAVQFGVSAAGNDVADSVANTAYAILFGEEGKDYTKKNPDGIAAWWAVEEAWGNGTASVAHFNILSGATVQAFDPIATLEDENTVFYWNSKDGFLETATEEEPVEEEPVETPDSEPAEGDNVYNYSEVNQFDVAIDWTLVLNEDGTYTLSEVNTAIGQASYEGTSYTIEGNVVTCGPMVEGPAIFDWANPEGFVVTIGKGVFAPEGVELPETPDNVYTYSEVNQFDVAIDWTLVINEDGTYTLSEVNTAIGEASYEGTSYTIEGNVITCGPMVEGPAIFDWANPEGFVATLHDDGTFTPGAEEAAAAGPGTYTLDEVNQFDVAIAWTLVLHEDGTYTLSEINDAIGQASYDGTSYTIEGNTLIAGPMVEGPGIYDWANPAGFTATLNADGTFTPVK